MLLAKYKIYLVAVGAFALSVTASYHLGKWQGRQAERVDMANARAEAVQKGVKTHGKKEREVKKLADPDLDVRLDKWMRD